MSEPKLISPMLDDYIMGGPISDHDGVRCCPAMRKNSDDKFIVKIISVPASQTQLDALLLTGAYPDKDSALAYFKDLADGIVNEKGILDRLSQLEGFVSYDDCQVVPMEDATGFDVYLLGKYRKTLERYIAANTMTHLGAVNLGLDLCAGLAICRRSGYLCIDIKPSNIFITGEKEYCIGDLGFARLNSLKYESLPNKYRNSYTAPEVEDAFAALSETMDIYAVGLVLYQVFNGGTLPFSDSQLPKDKLSAPAYADEEMAAIILKACDPDPSQRWQDPVQMGQAIVSYMQKNEVNDTPLVAASVVEEEPEAARNHENLDTPISSELDTISDLEQEPLEIACDTVDAQIPTAVDRTVEEGPEAQEESAEVEEVEETADEQLADETSAAADIVAESFVAEEFKPEATEESEPEDTEESKLEDSDDSKLEDAEESEPTVTVLQQDFSDEEYDNLSFLDDLPDDADTDYESVTDEIQDILHQVDELAAHQIPEAVIAPEPIEIKIPEPIVAEEESIESNETVDETDSNVPVEESDEKPVLLEESVNEAELPYVPKKKRTGLIWCIVLLVVIGLAAGGYFFYQNYYLQPIHSLMLNGAEDRLEVRLSADLDESLLKVVCSDPHGNNFPAPVVNGTAVFSGLTPDTAYTVSVEVDGFHKLTGTTSKVYSTPVQTKIAQMSIVTGSESGSVILSFAVEGPDSDQWNVIYNAEGEAERVTAFPAHMVTLTGLTVGKEYTFRLEPVNNIYLNGETEVKYVVKDLVCAENLQVINCADGILTAQWNAPANTPVSQWSVRCYSDAGFDKTITTQETSATFDGIDDSSAFTIEVTAAEMSVSKRVQVSANSVTVSNFTVSDKSSSLKLKWKANRSVPDDGWIVRYSVDGVSAPKAITTTQNSVTVPRVPNGKYVFTISDSSGNTALGGPFIYQVGNAASFNAYSVKKSELSVRLCKTPSSSSWSYKDIDEKDYLNTFPIGQRISMVLSLSGSTKASNDKVIITYAIYDEMGKLVDFSHDEQTWQSMWYKNYCELDVPSVPAEVGTYNLVLLFNGAEAGSQKFAITN